MFPITVAEPEIRPPVLWAQRTRPLFALERVEAPVVGADEHLPGG